MKKFSDLAVSFFTFLLIQYFINKILRSGAGAHYGYYMALFGFTFFLSTLSLIPKYGRKVVSITAILLSVLFYVNVVYMRAFLNLIPLTAYFNVGNLRGFEDSVIPYLEPWDIFYITPLIMMFAAWHFIPAAAEMTRKCRMLTLSAFFSASGLLIGFCGWNTITADHSFWLESMRQGGILPHLCNQVKKKILINRELSKEDIDNIKGFCQRDKSLKSEFSGAAKGKNLIFVIVESLESWPIFKKTDNDYIMPFLNSLTQGDSIVYGYKVISQVSHGRSIDGQFILNTGILPPKDDVISISYCDNQFPSIARALKSQGYGKSWIMNPSRSWTWNQDIFTRTLGIDRQYSFEQLEQDDVIRNFISDRSLYRQGREKMLECDSAFYCIFLPNISHSPFDIDDSAINRPVYTPDNYIDYVKDYIRVMRYVDESLEFFVKQLKEKNLWDNSVVIITADHNTAPVKEEPDIFKDYPELASNKLYSPLLILNVPHKEFIDREICQADIYSTIIDLMGIDAYWTGLGESVFSAPSDTLNKGMLDRNHLEEMKSVSDRIIVTDYFRKRHSK